MTNLSNSIVERKNILNNKLALEVIREKLIIPGYFYNDTYLYTYKQIADFYKVDVRTIERIVEINKGELNSSGYMTLKGNELKKLKQKQLLLVPTSISVPESE